MHEQLEVLAAMSVQIDAVGAIASRPRDLVDQVSVRARAQSFNFVQSLWVGTDTAQESVGGESQALPVSGGHDVARGCGRNSVTVRRGSSNEAPCTPLVKPIHRIPNEGIAQILSSCVVYSLLRLLLLACARSLQFCLCLL